MAAVRAFEKNVDMKKQYDMDAKKNTKKYIHTKNPSEYVNRDPPAKDRRIDRGRKSARKCSTHDDHSACPCIAIMSIPSLSLLSFSCTNALITLDNGYSNAIIISKAKVAPIAAQNPLLNPSGLGKSATPTVLMLNAPLLHFANEAGESWHV
jgi:hypothetical protein